MTTRIQRIRLKIQSGEKISQALESIKKLPENRESDRQILLVALVAESIKQDDSKITSDAIELLESHFKKTFLLRLIFKYIEQGDLQAAFEFVKALPEQDHKVEILDQITQQATHNGELSFARRAMDERNPPSNDVNDEISSVFGKRTPPASANLIYFVFKAIEIEELDLALDTVRDIDSEEKFTLLVALAFKANQLKRPDIETQARELLTPTFQEHLKSVLAPDPKPPRPQAKNGPSSTANSSQDPVEGGGHVFVPHGNPNHRRSVDPTILG